MNKGLWPIVAMAGILTAAITIILTVTPDSNMAARSTVLVLVPMLGTLLGGVWISRNVAEVKQHVAEVKEQVNGRMSEMIAKLPDGEPAPVPPATTTGGST